MDELLLICQIFLAVVLGCLAIGCILAVIFLTALFVLGIKEQWNKIRNSDEYKRLNLEDPFPTQSQGAKDQSIIETAKDWDK